MRWLATVFKHPSFGPWLAATSVLVTLLILGSAMMAYKLEFVREVRHIGHADEAAYAEMGRALVEGRGFQIQHVSWFFLPYDPDITRREDHWPPFMGMVIAPCFLIWGIQAWVAKLPAIFFGSIGLPLATAALGLAFSRRAYVGLLAALAMLVNLSIFTESLKTLSDVATAMLVTAFAAAVIAARDRPWLHLLAGLVLALAYFAKGSMILLLGLYPLAAMLACGWRVVLRPWLYGGIGVALLCMGPWWATNWVQYGRPLHSTQNFASGYIGLDNWEQRTYAIYWGQDLPRTQDRWTKYAEQYWPYVRRNREAFTRWGLLGPRAGEREWYKFGATGAAVHRWLLGENADDNRLIRRHERRGEQPQWASIRDWSDRYATLAGLGAVAFLAGLVVLRPPVALGRWWWRRRRAAGSRGMSREDEIKPDPLAGPTLALLLILASHWLFIVYLWEAMPRLAFVFLPSVAVLGVTAVSRVIEFPLQWTVPRWWRRWCWTLTPPLCAIVLGYAWFNVDYIKAVHQASTATNRYPYVDEPFYPQMSDWIREHLPGAIVMTRRPWQLRFHLDADHKAVAMPYASPQEILGVAKYYGVTHYLDDQNRPGMQRLLRQGHPGLHQLEAAPGRLYEIRWDLLPPEMVQLPGEAATARGQ